MNYVYKLFIGYHKKYELKYDSVFVDVYFSRNEAISAGKNDILLFIKNRLCNINDFLINYDYEFYISVINLNRIKFNNLIDRWNYIKNNIPKDKSKIYEFLTIAAENVYEVYDYNGYFKYGIIDPWEMELSYKTTFEPINLYIGDIVKKNGYKNLYKVIEVPNNKNDLLSYSDIIDILPINSNDEDDIEQYSYTELIKV